MTNITQVFKTRYSTKAFDSSKKITAEDFAHLQNALQLSPSSVNLQPWHFVIASSEEGKAKMSKSTEGFFVFNKEKVLNASHVVVLCAKTNISNNYLEQILEQEDTDGRYTVAPDAKTMVRGARKMFVDIHKYDFKDEKHWMEKQVYINLGGLLTSAAVMGIDALPIEGFDMKVFDEEFNLREKGFTAVAMVALGYKAEDDFNAKAPKSRLPEKEIFTLV